MKPSIKSQAEGRPYDVTGNLNGPAGKALADLMLDAEGHDEQNVRHREKGLARSTNSRGVTSNITARAHEGQFMNCDEQDKWWEGRGASHAVEPPQWWERHGTAFTAQGTRQVHTQGQLLRKAASEYGVRKQAD
jgi:hypothetical protein